MPFLKDLSTFVLEDWSEQSPSPFQKAASAVGSCSNTAHQPFSSAAPPPTASQESRVSESKGFVEQFVDEVMTEAQDNYDRIMKAKANLMQGLAPANCIRVGSVVTRYLNQMLFLRTLHLSNCIPIAHPDDTVCALGVVGGKYTHTIF